MRSRPASARRPVSGDVARRDTMTIGAVARAAGVGVETIRFYEREGLLPPPARNPANGYRRFPADTVDRLRFIARAKALGFTLREIRELLELRADPDGSCRTVRAKARHKLEGVRAKIEDLRRIERTLEALARACPGDGGVGDCPILAALEGGSDHER